jgi:hypothetical protein
MKKFIGFAFLSLAAFLLIASVLAALAVRHKGFQEAVIRQLEKQFDYEIQLGSFDVSLFPPVSVIARDIVIAPPGTPEKKILQASKLRITLNIWLLLFRKVELARVEAWDATYYVSWVEGARIPLSGLDVELRHVAWKRPVYFSIRAKGGDRDLARAEGEFFLQPEGDKVRLSSLKASVEASGLDLAKFPVPESKEVIQTKEGILSWRGGMLWEGNRLSLDGEGTLRRLIYALPQTPNKVSVPTDLAFKSSLAWDAPSRTIELRQISLRSVFGDFTLDGRVGGEAGSWAITLQSSNLNLDHFSKFLIPFDRAIPNKFGFSGDMGFHLFLKEKDAVLSAKGSLSLTPSLLSYAHYFNKPKDVPMEIQFDWQVRGGRMIQGDFNVWLKEMSLKGSLVDLDLAAGIGEITFLTNKFSLEGWEDILQPMRPYPVKGQAKILFNGKGSFVNLDGLGYSATVNIEGGEADLGGFPIRGLSALLEFSTLRSSSGKLDFMAKSSPVEIEYIRNVPPNESLSVKLLSSELYPQEILPAVSRLLNHWRGPGHAAPVDQAQAVALQILGDATPLRNLSLSFSRMDSLLTVQEFYFYLYEGLVRGAGEIVLGAEDSHFNFGLQAEKLSLRPLVSQLTRKSLAEGNLYFLGHMEGENLGEPNLLNRLRGGGEFKIIDGTCNTFDLLGSIGTLANALGAPPGAGVTRFNDLHADFVLLDGRVVTDELVFAGTHYSGRAQGFFSLEGALNYQLMVFLDEELTRKILGSRGKEGWSVPLQLYGTLEHPRLGLDATTVKAVADKLLPESLKRFGRGGRFASGGEEEKAIAQEFKEKGLTLLQEMLGRRAGSSPESQAAKKE